MSLGEPKPIESENVKEEQCVRSAQAVFVSERARFGLALIALLQVRAADEGDTVSLRYVVSRVRDMMNAAIPESELDQDALGVFLKLLAKEAGAHQRVII